MTWIIPKNLHTSLSARVTEGLILDSNELSEILGQSLIVRSKPMQSRTWLLKLKRDSWTRLLYGRTLRRSLGNIFAEEWTSSQEASLVSPSHLRDIEEEMKILDTSSPISSEESPFSDLPLFSSKTSRESSPLNSEKDGVIEKERPFCSMFSASWKDWITKRRREYLARAKSALLINESESLLWGTPRRDIRATGGGDPKKYLFNFRLENQVQSFQVDEEKSSSNGNRAELFPTPTANEHKYRLKGSSQASGNLNAIYRGKLNPRWVETLMGIPIGWTMVNCVNPYVIERMNCDSSETESSHLQPNERSEPFGKNWSTPNTRDHKGPQGDGFLDRGYGYKLPDHVKEEETKKRRGSRI